MQLLPVCRPERRASSTSTVARRCVLPSPLRNPANDAAGNPTERLFFPDHYGEFDLEHLTLYSSTFVDEENRLAQNNFQICTSILASLSEDAEAAHKGVVEITDVARRIRLGHRGAA